MENLKVKILVAYHKESLLIRNDFFEPIHVGKELSNLNLEMISDNEGDNISLKNSNYSELTALYWGWKNLKDENYIGLCHYRRFFSFNQSLLNYFKERISFILGYLNFNKFDNSIRNIEPIYNSEKLSLEIEKFTSFLKKDIEKNNTDLYALKGAIFAKKSIKTLFSKPNGEFVLDLLVKIVDEKYPKYTEPLKNTLLGNKIHYANMTIMKNDIFNEYCTFLFDVLETHEKYIVKSGWCIDIEKEQCYFRLSGYLGELLTSTFVSFNITNNKKVKLLNVISYME